MAEARYCDGCAHWHKTSVKAGQCRRFPPVVIGFDAKSGTQQSYPTTSAHFWCGEWQDRKPNDRAGDSRA